MPMINASTTFGKPARVIFFFNDTPPTEIYTLSLHDALPISDLRKIHGAAAHRREGQRPLRASGRLDRKSTRLNSSHMSISYAVFCLKKKKNRKRNARAPQGAQHAHEAHHAGGDQAVDPRQQQ